LIRLLLSVCDSIAAARLQWQQELEFFHTVNLDRSGPFTEFINAYCKAGGHLPLAWSSLGAIIMQSDRLILHIDKKGFKNFEDERKVEELHGPYEVLWNDTENFRT
jgi:hypothetical protein